MRNTRNTGIAALTAIIAMAAAPAVATPIVGTAVDMDGNPIASGDGQYYFYIPLSGTEYYDGSLTSDSCNNYAGECVGGVLEMNMHFAADWTGQTQVSFDFDDLDVDGFNDTDYFFEVLGLTVRDSDGLTLLTLSENEVMNMLTGDSSAQQLAFGVNTTGGFNVHLTFGTEFENAPHRRYRNTLESIYGTAVSVPEPGTLVLLGAGLLLLAFSRRRMHLRGAIARD